MSYASIMVAVDDGLHAPARVRLAADLAHRLGARLVGAAACMPDYPRGYGETAVPMGMVIEQIRQAALNRLAGVEQVFRHASCLNDRVVWRSDLVSPVLYIESQSRIADLVVVARYADDEGVTVGMAVDAGDVDRAAELMGWHVRESRIGFLARTEPADRVADLRATPPALPPTIPSPTIPAPSSSST